MRFALAEARAALAHDDVPVGSVGGGFLRGGRASRTWWEAAVITATAFSKASSVAAEVFWTPLILRTY